MFKTFKTILKKELYNNKISTLIPMYRCPQYNNLPAECKLASDPDDPCCLAPKCNITDPKKIPTAAPGVISGIINIPTPAPVPGGPTLAPKLFSKSSCLLQVQCPFRIMII